MARYSIDAAALARIPSEASVDSQVKQLAEQILDEAQGSAPVDTGALRASGFVDGSDSEYTIGFDRDYAPYVEMGTGDTEPQPFLTPAATKQRGSL